MKLRVVFSAQARADLTSIYSFIARDNPKRGRSYVNDIEASCQRLRDHPRMGVQRNDLREGLHTMALWGKIVVAYKIMPGKVRILRVFSAGRDYEAILRTVPDDI
jgi:toxin ParE1/3/4